MLGKNKKLIVVAIDKLCEQQPCISFENLHVRSHNQKQNSEMPITDLQLI